MTASDHTLAKVVRALEAAYTELALLAETTGDVPPEVNATREAIGDLLLRLKTAAFARMQSAELATAGDPGGRVRLRIKSLKPAGEDVGAEIIPLTAVTLVDHATSHERAQQTDVATPIATGPPPIPHPAVTPSLVERLRNVQPASPRPDQAPPPIPNLPARASTDRGVLARDAQARLAQLEAELDRFSHALASPTRRPSTFAIGGARDRHEQAPSQSEAVTETRSRPSRRSARDDWYDTADGSRDEATVEIRGGRRNPSSNGSRGEPRAVAPRGARTTPRHVKD